MSNGLKEKLLLFRLKLKRNPEAFGEFFDLYHNKIYRYIFFKVSNKEEAKDLTSETFLRVWQHINQNKPITNLNALLYSVAKNLIIDHYRKQAQLESAPEEMLQFIPDDKSRKIVQEMDIKEDLKVITKSLIKIKEEYQEVIVLRFVEDLAINEVAEIMNISAGNVRVLQHRAFAALRKELLK